MIRQCAHQYYLYDVCRLTQCVGVEFAMVMWPSVMLCECVCVSVMLTYCAQTTEAIIMQTPPDYSPAILVFPHQI